MFSNLSSSEHPYTYQPAVHIPIRTSSLTIGEVGASVDLIRTQLNELSKRMEMMESTFSHFQNCFLDDTYLLKNTLSEHSNELLNVRDVVDTTHEHVKKTHALIEEQDLCIDKLAHAVSKANGLYKRHQQQQENGIKKVATTNIQLGMIRRRLSKVEDFTTEFYDQFQSFKCVKDIILNLSEHLDECDRDISLIVTKNNEQVICHPCDPYNNQDDRSDLNNYFSNYNSDDDNNGDDDGDDHQYRMKDIHYQDYYQTSNNIINNISVKSDHQEQEQEVVIEYDDFEKL